MCALSASWCTNKQTNTIRISFARISLQCEQVVRKTINDDGRTDGRREFAVRVLAAVWIAL